MQSQEVEEDMILSGTLEVMPIPRQGGLMILKVGYLLHKACSQFALRRKIKKT